MTPLQQRAQTLLSQTRDNPGDVYLQARRLSFEAHQQGDTLAAVIADHAAGAASVWRGDLSEAQVDLERAVLLGTSAGYTTEAAAAGTVLAHVMARSGNFAGALEVANRIEPLVDGPLLGRLLSVLGFIHGQLGDVDFARTCYERSVAELADGPDDEALANVLSNRGVFEWKHGGYQAAIDNFERAQQLNLDHGRLNNAALTQHNLGLACIAAGQVPLGLRLMEEASTSIAALGIDRSILLLDLCRVLADLGLAEEALEAGHEAARLLISADAGLELTELALILSRAALAIGDHPLAIEYARRAVAGFQQQGRAQAVGPPRALLQLALLARGDAHDLAGIDAADLDPAAALYVCELLLQSSRPELAGDLAQQTLTNLEQDEGANAALQCAVASTVVALVSGHHQEALAATQRGVRAASENATLLGSIEMRALTLRQATRLGSLGCQAGLAAADPIGAFMAVEGTRALAAHLRPPTVGADARVDELLAEIRQLDLQMAQTVEPVETIQLHHDRAERERQLRSRTRQSTGDGAHQSSTVPSREDLARRLGDRTLISFASSRGELQAFVMGGDGVLHHRQLGSSKALEPVVEDMQHGLLAHALRRSTNMAARRLDRAKAALEATVFEPLQSLFGDDELVIVPGGGLDGVPWPLLDRFLGRAVTLVSGALTWRAPTPGLPTRPLIAAGPGLEHAEHEAESVAALYPARQVLSVAEATVPSILSGLARADVLHLCAHGRFRADNPMLSHLQVSDGPLYLYDLDHAPALPRLMIFSACEVGLGVVAPEGSLVGIAAALTGRGCERIVASAVPVRDDETAVLMQQLHVSLRRGVSIEVALAQAQASLVADGALSVAGFAVLAVA